MPHVTRLPSYIQDTPDLLHTLEGVCISQGASLGVIDVEALYSSIHHNRGLEVVSSFIDEMNRTQWPLNRFSLDLLQQFLHSNVFLYAGSHFLQVQGVPHRMPSINWGGGGNCLPERTCQCC